MLRKVLPGFLILFVAVAASRSGFAGDPGKEPYTSAVDPERSGPALFRLSNAELDRDERRRLQAIRGEPSAVRVWPVEIDTECLTTSIGPVRCAIPGHPFIAWQTENTKRSEGDDGFSWRGAVASQLDVLSLEVAGDVYAEAFSPRYQFRISPLGEGLHAIQWRDPSYQRRARRQDSGVLFDKASKFEETNDEVIAPLNPVAPYRWPVKPRNLFASESIKSDTLSGGLRERYDSMNGRKDTERVDIVRINEEALTADTQWLTILSPAGAAVSAFRMESYPNRKRPDRFTWTGALVISESSQLDLVVNGPFCNGTLQYANLKHEIRPISERLHALIQVDQAKYPPDESENFPSGALED